MHAYTCICTHGCILVFHTPTTVAEIKVSQRWALLQHSCKALCPICSNPIVNDAASCGDCARSQTFSLTHALAHTHAGDRCRRRAFVSAYRGTHCCMGQVCMDSYCPPLRCNRDATACVCPPLPACVYVPGCSLTSIHSPPVFLAVCPPLPACMCLYVCLSVLLYSSSCGQLGTGELGGRELTPVDVGEVRKRPHIHVQVRGTASKEPNKEASKEGASERGLKASYEPSSVAAYEPSSARPT
jgi:hypothetical protein